MVLKIMITKKLPAFQRNLRDHEEICGITKKFAGLRRNSLSFSFFGLFFDFNMVLGCIF